MKLWFAAVECTEQLIHQLISAAINRFSFCIHCAAWWTDKPLQLFHYIIAMDLMPVKDLLRSQWGHATDRPVPNHRGTGHTRWLNLYACYVIYIHANSTGAPRCYLLGSTVRAASHPHPFQVLLEFHGFILSYLRPQKRRNPFVNSPVCTNFSTLNKILVTLRSRVPLFTAWVSVYYQIRVVPVTLLILFNKRNISWQLAVWRDYL